jgi:hypothetical protein
MKLRLLKTGLFLAIVANLVACKQESIRGELVKSKGASAIWILDKDGNSVDMGEGQH